MNAIHQALLAMLITAAGALAAPIVSISFNNSPVSGIGGSTVTLMATMINTTGVTENLNGDGFSLSGTPFTLANFNDSAFMNNWPLFLSAGASYGPAALFSFTIPVSAAAGNYTGTFNLLGGPGANDQNLIGSASFNVNVNSSVPEPASGAAMLLGLGALAFGLVRKRARIA
jgi:hypothetical protein